MTAINTTGKGAVGIFGDNLKIVDIDKNSDILTVTESLHTIGKGIGGGTENGIWMSL